MTKLFLIIWPIAWLLVSSFAIFGPQPEEQARVFCVTTTRHGPIC